MAIKEFHPFFLPRKRNTSTDNANWKTESLSMFNNSHLSSQAKTKHLLRITYYITEEFQLDKELMICSSAKILKATMVTRSPQESTSKRATREEVNRD